MVSFLDIESTIYTTRKHMMHARQHLFHKSFQIYLELSMFELLQN